MQLGRPPKLAQERRPRCTPPSRTAKRQKHRPRGQGHRGPQLPDRPPERPRMRPHDADEPIDGVEDGQHV
eukprot:4152613-Pyramimonas_sp.AAC.1